MDYYQESLRLHHERGGKMVVAPTFPLATRDDLSVAYTPGVAEPCRVIVADPERAYDLTIKGHTIAIVTDSSAVLGLGNIHGVAGLPVMEGKAILVKRFSGLDAFPICLSTQDTEEIIQAVRAIAPGFAAIMLEDISAPRCFEIERRLTEELDIPVMHDDQHGTATVVLAGLTNALRVVHKEPGEASVVVVGAGAAGIAIAELLLAAGFQNLTLVDSRGIIAEGRAGMNPFKDDLARRINPVGRQGTLAEALTGADVFIGVSAPGIVTAEMVRTMARQPIVFAMSNPTPEIMPDEARAGGAAVIATGRSDFPNQANNVLVFPGIFRGAVEARHPRFTMAMKLAAARELAVLVEEPVEERILPSPFDPGVMEAVAAAVRDTPA
jgi:malate dehydrogenase (oxaloacetate-decarboxylating)